MFLSQTCLSRGYPSMASRKRKVVFIISESRSGRRGYISVLIEIHPLSYEGEISKNAKNIDM